MSTSDQQALTGALQSVYAAVYAYGLIAAYANPTRATQVATLVAAHRAVRDEAVDLLASAGAPIPREAAGYTVPFPVTDPKSAARLAVRVEDDCAVAWRAALERADAEAVRDIAVQALADCAVRAGNWNVALNVQPPTTAFPGQR
ncbi:ferritin-like domain-containing protein [Rhodococcus sp. D2-41]|nr:ferritin-like domain-containing protein [Rhodococcus sp. D2-41]MDG3010950.1 ferritin-like domain-containing protein [Rhodococcus sp. D2-41]